ncbi:hypothetical protein FN846DRAFT_990157, partial [Sphaerosporella brunnea]
GVSSTRASACELVACDLTSSLSAVEALQYLCHELPVAETEGAEPTESTESTFLLSGRTGGTGSSDPESGRKKQFEGTNNGSTSGMTTLEIAILADCKKFISHRPVQRIINGIWDGSISFWKSLDVDGSKSPHFFNPRKSDPFCRLRVPKYQKVFEAIFFATLLGLYYFVLVERNPYHIMPSEIALIVFFAAFAVHEFSSIKDSGVTFYAADFWSWLDMFIIVIALVFMGFRIAGVVKDSDAITDTAFDVLSLEALLLVPRMFSLFSLDPYFGVLIPCLKQMTKEFLKFSVLILILYLGFLTTFSLLARDRMSFNDVWWMLINVFFGSSSVGFNAMREISPILGPPLMMIFVIMTNILLVTSLISLLSNSLTNMMANAREEYFFMFSTMVLEASTSNRLVVFYPPLNLLPLILLRPLRLWVPAQKLRKWRIALLKFSHCLFAAAILVFEKVMKRGENGTRYKVWGPNNNSDKKSSHHGLGIGGGIGILNRNSIWNGRLAGAGRFAGGRLGLGHGGWQAGGPPGSSSSSVRIDEREREDPDSRLSRLTAEDREELRRIRASIEELSSKMDAIISQNGAV